MTVHATPLARFDIPDEPPPPSPEPIDLRPASAYEAITRQMVESLDDDLREIKARLNGLIFMMVGAIVLDIIGRAFGT
jgi:hypothetical protein